MKEGPTPATPTATDLPQLILEGNQREESVVETEVRLEEEPKEPKELKEEEEGGRVVVVEGGRGGTPSYTGSPNLLSTGDLSNPALKPSNSCSLCPSKTSSQNTTDSESVEGEEGDEAEPVLKYVRLSNSSFTSILSGDAISSSCCGKELLVVGTYGGFIHILDLNGSVQHSVQLHTTTVNDLVIDLTQMYLASCSDDGSIVISGLVDRKFRQVKRYPRPVKAIALAPDFAQSSTMLGLAQGSQRFVSGGMQGCLVLNEKGWFGFQDTILSSDDGPILNIKWKGPYIAWASDSGVKVYNVDSKQRIAYISRNQSIERPELFLPNLYWNDKLELYVGWANQVKVAQIKTLDPSLHPHIQSQLSPANLTHVFSTDFVVSGLLPFQNQLVVLATTSNLLNQDLNDAVGDSNQAPTPPEIRLIDPIDLEASSDIVPVHGYEKFKPNDYHLVLHPDRAQMYLICPKDLILAKPRDLNDRIDYFLSTQNYAQALHLVQTFVPSDSDSFALRHSVPKVGKLYMEHLLQTQDYARAAALCPEVLGEDVNAWEKWVYAFASIDRLEAIVEYVPTRAPVLGEAIYEMILNFLLATDASKFLATLKGWPSNLFSTQAIVEATLDLSSRRGGQDPTLKEALAELYQLAHRYDLALQYFLELQNPIAFRLIQGYHLYPHILNQTDHLMQFDVTTLGGLDCYKRLGVRVTSEGRAVGLLVRHHEQIPVEQVVERLKLKSPLFLHVYLHALFHKDPTLGKRFHDLQVELYAEFDYPLLLPFLKSSNYYSLELAYQICDRRDLVPEIIFVLSRMGDHHKALHLIIERLNDVEQAIEFAKLHDDPSLWDDLLKYSSDKPEFLKGLLETSGSHLPPNQVIQAIPTCLPIPDLKQSIIKILQDYNLQMSLRRGCEKVLNRDCTFLSSKLKRFQHRGIAPNLHLTGWVQGEPNSNPINPVVHCLLCHQPLHPTSNWSTVVFFCSHTYHLQCLQTSPHPDLNGTFPGLRLPLTFPTPDDPLSDLLEVKLALKERLKQHDLNCPRCSSDSTESKVGLSLNSNLANGKGKQRGSKFKLRWSYHPPPNPSSTTTTRREEISQDLSSLKVPHSDLDLPPMVPFR